MCVNAELLLLSHVKQDRVKLTLSSFCDLFRKLQVK